MLSRVAAESKQQIPASGNAKEFLTSVPSELSDKKRRQSCSAHVFSGSDASHSQAIGAILASCRIMHFEPWTAAKQQR